MGNAPEVIREVGVHNFRAASKQRIMYLDCRLLGITARTVGVLLWWKISFVDRSQYQHRCCHADTISQGRNPQRSKLAIGFRYPHSSDRLRLVALFSECKSQFAEPSLHPIRVDILKILCINTRCALIRTALGVSVRQNIFSVYLVVQGVETIADFCLRFRV